MNLHQLETRAATLGVTVIHSAQVPAEAGGAAVKKNGRWYIVVSSLLEDPDRTLTLAHELAHILLEHQGDRRYEEADLGQEAEADKLAVLLTSGSGMQAFTAAVLRCRGCGSNVIDVQHEWKETVRGRLARWCRKDCEQYSDLIPAAMVDYARYDECGDVVRIEDGAVVTRDSSCGDSENEYFDKLTFCSTCGDLPPIMADYNDLEDPEVEVEEGSHVFSLTCGQCHAHLDCPKEMADFLLEVLA
jgi:hypothetical protein